MNLIKILDSFRLLPGSENRALQEHLSQHRDALQAPEMRRSICLGDIPDWSEFRVPLPRTLKEHYGFSDLVREEYGVTMMQLSKTTERSVRFDIKDVEGVANAREDLSRYKSLDDYAEAEAGDLIADGTHEAMNRLLESPAVRITKGKGGDNLVRHSNDGRYFLSNHGGAREFAAARYIARKLGSAVPMVSQLVEHHVSVAHLMIAKQHVAVFAVRRDPGFMNGLQDLLATSGAEHYLRPFSMGEAHRANEYIAVAFPRESAASKAAISVFERAGALNVLEFMGRPLFESRLHEEEVVDQAQGPRP